MRGRNAALVDRYFPGYRSPKAAYADVLSAEICAESVWLDLGCGQSVCGDRELNRELPRRARLAVGVDRDPYLRSHPSIGCLVIADADALPFRARTFSVVTASMVVEHLQDPERTFEEVARVCARDARFVIFTPNVFHYGSVVARLTPQWFHLWYRKVLWRLNRGEWRDFDGEMFPTWFRANSVGRLRRQLSAAGFETTDVRMLSLAHSFGFVRPLYAASLLFECLVHRLGLDVLKADILAVFRRR